MSAASYLIDLGRLSLTPSLAFTTYNYDSTTIFGVPSSQAYRDRDVVQGAVTTRYQLSPQHDLLLVTRALGVNYTAPQPGQPTRNSTGYEVLVGLADEAGAVWQYRALVGWEMRAFAASQYSTHQAPIVEAAVTWNPSGVNDLDRQADTQHRGRSAGRYRRLHLYWCTPVGGPRGTAQFVASGFGRSAVCRLPARRWACQPATHWVPAQPGW